MPWSHLLFYFLLMHYPIIAKFSIKSIPFFKKIQYFSEYFPALVVVEVPVTLYIDVVHVPSVTTGKQKISAITGKDPGRL